MTESIGEKVFGGSWHLILPEGGIVPTAIVALLGGFYPLLGHWYLTERENTDAYRKCMAAPAKGAWLTLMVATFICGIFNKMHPFFGCSVDLGVMLIVFYMLPFYPFDTFGGRRVRDHSDRIYGIFLAFSIITLVCMGASVNCLKQIGEYFLWNTNKFNRNMAYQDPIKIFHIGRQQWSFIAFWKESASQK